MANKRRTNNDSAGDNGGGVATAEAPEEIAVNNDGSQAIFNLSDLKEMSISALTQVAIHAFNEWLHDEWTYDYEGRMFATPVVNPCVLDEGIDGDRYAIRHNQRVQVD